ncbi:hypothetical protein SAMN06297422_10142 [Lachnospiraceae bacterium]|nr:hypothetical protein SAMN06297422_10142 [Lachnospiraceae bacterium]
MKDDQNQEIEQLINDNQQANDAEMAALNNEMQRNREANALNNHNINNFFNNMANNNAVADDDEELNDLQDQVNNENQLNNQNQVNNENQLNNQNDPVEQAVDEEINQMNQDLDREDADLLNQAIQNQQNQNLQAQPVGNEQNANDDDWVNVEKDEIEQNQRENEFQRQRDLNEQRHHQQEQERQNRENQINNLNNSAQRMRNAEAGINAAADNMENNRNADRQRQQEQERQNRENQINNLNASAERMRALDQGMNDDANRIDNNQREAARRQRQQELQRRQEEIRRAREQNRQQVREMLRQQELERQRQADARRLKEANDEFKRTVYKAGRDSMVSKANKGYESVMKYFAPDNGFQYPPGITPELAAATVMGAAIDKNWLLDNYPDKIQEAGSLENLQKKILNDITSGGQLEPYILEIGLKSFQRATVAVDAFGSGKQGYVKDYLRNLADYSANTVGDIRAADGNLSDGLDPEQMTYKFCQEVVINGPLQVKPNEVDYTQINNIKLNSLSMQIDAMKAAEQRKQRLIKEVSTLTPAQKEELAAEMLLDNYIANMANKEKKKLEAATKKNREDAFRNVGLNEQDPKWNRYTASQNTFYDNKAKEASYIINKNTVSEFDVLMQTPGARDILKRQYMAKIKESDVYRRIVNSDNAKTMVDSLIEADVEATKGMDAIPDFKIDPAVKRYTKELNDSHRPKLEEQLSQVNRELVHKAMNKARTTDAIGNGSLVTYDVNHDSISANAEAINSMYQTIKRNDTITGSKSYGDMKTALKELRDYTRGLADHNTPMGSSEVEKYKELVNKVDNLADHYLMNKKNLDDPSSLDKVNGVRTLKRRLLTSTHKIDTALEFSKRDHSNQLFGDKFRRFDHFDPAKEDNNPFYGNKYKNPESRKINSGACSGFTTMRSAGTSIAIMCMAASGQYTFEDIMDPTKFVNEKKAIYDDVIMTLRDGDNPASREKIARTIHDGRIATDRMLEEQTKKIDFKNVDIYNDKQFIMTTHMYMARFDAEQEMMRIKPDYIKVAKESNPNFNSMNDANVIWSPMMELGQSMRDIKQNAYDAETSTNPTIARNAAAKLMSNTERIRHHLEEMDKKKQAAQNIPVNNWFSEAEHGQISATSAALEFAIVNKVPFKEYPEDIKPLLPKMIDGSMMKNVKYELDITKGRTKITSGFPSQEDIHNEAVNIKFLKKTDEAIRRLEGGKENYNNKKDFVTDCAYALFGQMYRASGMHTPIDATTGKKLSLEEFMRKQIKSGVFEKSLKSKKNPKEFTDPKNIAKMAKNKAKMQGIIKAHIDKNAERKAVKLKGKANVQRSNPSLQ